MSDFINMYDDSYDAPNGGNKFKCGCLKQNVSYNGKLFSKGFRCINCKNIKCINRIFSDWCIGCIELNYNKIEVKNINNRNQLIKIYTKNKVFEISVYDYKLKSCITFAQFNKLWKCK